MQWQYFSLGLNVILLILFYILFRQWKQLAGVKNEMRRQSRKMELRLDALELDSIRYKLNPHLFKNTLNTIQSHAYQTYYALDRLAHVLDYILYESEAQFVPLEKEISFAASLIEINRMKISQLFNLRIINKIDSEAPDIKEKRIAPLVTAHLIENAFKHADLQSPDSFISVVFELKEDVFELTVSNKINTKPVIKKGNSGFGGGSFEKRMNILYKGHYSLHSYVEDEVFISHLKIELVERKDQVYIAG